MDALRKLVVAGAAAALAMGGAGIAVAAPVASPRTTDPGSSCESQSQTDPHVKVKNDELVCDVFFVGLENEFKGAQGGTPVTITTSLFDSGFTATTWLKGSQGLYTGGYFMPDKVTPGTYPVTITSVGHTATVNVVISP